MQRVIITTPHCIECRSKKQIWDANGVSYREIEANSKEGQELIAKLNITAGGTVVDLDKMEIIT